MGIAQEGEFLEGDLGGFLGGALFDLDGVGLPEGSEGREEEEVKKRQGEEKEEESPRAGGARKSLVGHEQPFDFVCFLRWVWHWLASVIGVE